MPNIDLTRVRRISAFRRIAIGTWHTAYDPTVYGTVRVRMEEAERYIAAFRQATGRKLTITHLVTAAVARGLGECPELNGLLRFNRLYRRNSVDVSVVVLVSGDEGGDLSTATLRGADQMSLVEMLDSMDEQVSGFRSGRNEALKRTKGALQLVPLPLMNFFLKLIAFLNYDLNLDLTWLGLPKDPFGAATITSIGSLGLDTAYVPLVSYSRVPLFVAPGVVQDAAVVEDGEVVPGRILEVHASFDHRYIDGVHAMTLSRMVHKVLEHPFDELDPLPPAPSDP